MFVQKLISRIIYPFNFALILLLVGLFLISGHKRRLLGKWLVGVGIAFFLVTSYYPFASYIAGTLENQYQPLTVDEPGARYQSEELPKEILILNGGVIYDRFYPPSSQLGYSTVDRLVEGLRLYHAIPGATLYVSSAQGELLQTIGDMMQEFLVDRGVPGEDIKILRTGTNTAGEADVARAYFGERPFILVTSALHMPRAMMLFNNRDMQPIPAPVRFHTMRRTVLTVDNFMPTLRAAQMTQLAYHEYVGMLWALITGG
jgi:uncharacterized SAM-binding protein YcdF (DUF218 family)